MRHVYIAFSGLLILAFTFALSLTDGAAAVDASYQFVNVFPLDQPSYSAEEQIENCGGEYPDAEAQMWLRQQNGKTNIVIRVRNAPANALFTVWLKLTEPNPLTGAGVTALADPAMIPELAIVTPDSVLTGIAHDLGLMGDDGTGGDQVANSFRTDENGRGEFRIRLNFPVMKGAYQFNELHEDLAPVAIDNMPFTLRLATHCVDDMAHGLVAGIHEPFFDWGW